MMSLNIKKYALLLGLSVALSAGTTLAAQEGNDKNSASDKLLEEAMSLLDKVEINSPKTRSDVELIRKKLLKYKNFKIKSTDDNSPELMFSRMGSTTTAYSRNNKAKRVAFYNSCRNLNGDNLKQKLHDEVAKHKVYDYKEARRLMYSQIDNRNGTLECVYTGKVVSVPAGKMPSGNVINCEHTWPQSKGAVGDAKSDIHHLFPADPDANSKRGSFPFGYVKGNDLKFNEGGSKFDGDVFEVRRQHRGNVARAMFYFSTVYEMPIDAEQEATLRKWHKEDPVDANEMARNDAIEALQQNRNPYIDHPEYVEKIADF
ncbi:MAG: endonuclease [Candidatus Riflebacteria bacterium]|nr:endonuclease [Candidatus Riflebacteria bacterium]